MYSIKQFRIALVVIAVIFFERTTSQGDCGNLWITQSSWSVPGGSYDSSATTVLSCKTSCLRYPDCTGFDFDGSNRCWVVRSGTAKRAAGGLVTHYQRIKLSDNSSCTAGCNGGSALAYVESYNSHVNGGSSTDDTSFDGCAKRCLGSNCRGFDWDSENPQNKRCWISGFGSNPIQNDSPGVNHYEKQCAVNGIKEIPPNSIPWDQRAGSTPFPTVPTAVPQQTAGPPRAVAAGDYVYLKKTAIRPAYIVMAGLGGGCILLVIIAVAVLCMYPLKGDGGGGGGVYSKHKKTKTKTTKETTQTRRPKSTASDEHIGMSTVTTVQESNNRTSNGSAAAGYATATAPDDNDNYNRSNGGSQHHSSYHDEETRNSGGSVRQSAYAESARNSGNDDYNASQSGSQHHSGGYNNEGYNTMKSNNSQKSGFTNEGYNTMTSNRSHKSGYEDSPYDKSSHDDRGSTLERGHDRVSSIAEETDEHQNARNSGRESGAMYNQEDYM